MKKKYLFTIAIFVVAPLAFAFEAPVVELSQNADEQGLVSAQATQALPASQPTSEMLKSSPAPMVPEAANYSSAAQSAQSSYIKPSFAQQPSTASTLRASLTQEQRIARLEQQIDNLVQMNLPARLDDLQQQVQKLSGNSELLQHDLQMLNDKLRDFYKDLEQRINKYKASSIDGNIANAPQQPDTTLDSASTTLPSAAAASALPDQQSIPKEQKAYEDAFNLLQQKKYSAASDKFRDYLKNYPKGTFAINAHYWLAECNYLSDRLADAVREFKIVANRYPSSTKVPDAMLKVGLIYNSLGKHEQAKIELLKLTKRFPESNAAKLAAQQLATMP